MKIVAWILVGIAGLLVTVLVSAIFDLDRELEVVALLVFGWINFLSRTLPEVRVPPASIAVGLASVALVFFLGHATARWLRRETSPAARPWRFRSTAMLIGGLVLLFACGTAATGAAHHVGWLIKDDRPMWETRRHLDRIDCRGNLDHVFFELVTHARSNDGQMLTASTVSRPRSSSLKRRAPRRSACPTSTTAVA